MSIDPQTLLGAAVALFAAAVSAAELYCPHTCITRDAMLTAAVRDAEGLPASQQRALRRTAERLSLDVHEGRVTLGSALFRIACDATAMRREAPKASG